MGLCKATRTSRCWVVKATGTYLLHVLWIRTVGMTLILKTVMNFNDGTTQVPVQLTGTSSRTGIVPTQKRYRTVQSVLWILFSKESDYLVVQPLMSKVMVHFFYYYQFLGSESIF